MNILVTGATGRVAAFAIPELIKHGHKCLLLDKENVSGIVRKNLKCWSGITHKSFSEKLDAILHLAAIPRPTDAPADEVYANNVVATHNILEFALAEKVKKIVCASTEAVLGVAYSRDANKINYLPINEDHPTTPTDPYSFSKLTCEKLCDAYASEFPSISISTLRFAWVLCPITYETKLLKAQKDPSYGLSKIFSYSDARDVAKACHLAVQLHHPGHERFFIAADDTFTFVESDELIHQYFTHAENRFSTVGKNSSLISCAKAKSILGYKPEFNWRLL